MRELMSADGRKLKRFTGRGVEPLPLAGDYRDEVVCMRTTKNGAQALFVYANTEPIERRDFTRTASREYRLWLARTLGGGYRSYFEWEREP